MGNKLMIVGIVVLALIAVVLGYKIYQQTALKGPPVQSIQSVVKPTPTTTVKQSSKTTSNEISENNILQSSPGPNSSDEEKNKFLDAVKRLAKETAVLDITKCQPQPVVFKMRKAAQLQVRNNNNIEHTIIIDSEHQYSIPPNSTKTINTGLGVGSPGYRCGGVGFENEPLVGIIDVVD